MLTHKSRSTSPPRFQQIWNVLFALALVWLLLAAFGIYSWKSGRNMAVLGQFGDSFGVLNGFFTALAFGFVAWNAMLQRSTVDAQWAALEAQERELVDTRSVLARQAFETTFFQMIRTVRELQDGLVDTRTGLKGADAVSRFAEQSLSAIGGGIIAPGDGEAKRKAIGEKYVNLVYLGNEASLGPYFRTLYHVFKLIDRQGFEEAVARDYSNIARAQLSAHTLTILATNCCSKHGVEFVKYVNGFGLLKHFVHRELIGQLASGVYSQSAFLGANELPNW